MVTAALLAAGCIGRSLAEDSARIEVRWEFDSAYACTQDGPMMRIRSAPAGGTPDDEALDWVPCLDDTGEPRGVTAPLPLAVYVVSVRMATSIDGAILAESDLATTPELLESEFPYQVTVVFGPPATLASSVRALP